MSNQDNKLNDTLDKLDHYIKQLQKMIESQNTKAHDGPSEYEYHDNIGLALEIAMRMTVLMIDVSLRKKITRKFSSKSQNFMGILILSLLPIG